MRVLQNHLVQSIPVAHRSSFVADLTRMDIAAKSRLALAGTSMTMVYFPIGAVISGLYESNGAAVEIRGAGRDGMLGAAVASSPEHTRFDLVCQIAGPVLSMPYATFEAHARQNVALALAIVQYSVSVRAFLTQSVACNALHTIAQRCARWLLITSDRVGSIEFLLTHDLLARLIGARRPGVSVAVRRLLRLQLIEYRAGRIRILDKVLLEAQSCECYSLVVRETTRIFRVADVGRLTARRTIKSV